MEWISRVPHSHPRGDLFAGFGGGKTHLRETFVVLGLGILGQLTVQMLGANGCRAIGIDTDRSRIDKALSLGMEHGVHPADAETDIVARMTDGYGADGVIITAATPSDDVVSSAFNMPEEGSGSTGRRCGP